MKTIVIGVFAVSAVFGQMAATYNGGAFQFSVAANSETPMFGVESVGGKVVIGKPFSAVEERHSLQVLGDGTRIESKETNRLFRDEQGRTRIEHSGGNVSIVDPVAGFTAELHPDNTVSKGTLIVREGRVVGKGLASSDGVFLPVVARERASGDLEKAQAELSQARSRYTETSPQVKQLEAALSDLQKVAASSGNGFTFQPGGPTRTFEFQTPTGTSAVVLRVGAGDNGAVESLAAQMINGAMADGTRTTETIPVGKIGNDRAISIVNERWFSSDLQMLVKSTSSDPRFGDTTYQLTNITQTSPDPSLFQIPADYAPRK